VKKSIFQCALTALAAAALVLCVASATHARQGGTTRYVYDDNGRLHAVVTPSGEAVVYDYDAAGNIAAVRRVPADELAIFAFAPRAGLYGDPVTFIGTGFGFGVSAVSFNGTPARVLDVTASTVVAEVPQGATTGPVTITTPRGSVTTAEPFTIAGVFVSPTSASVKFGQTAQFTAQVLPSTLDQTVTWSVNDIVGGNASVGTVSALGLYTAPSSVQTVTVRATSVADPLRFAEAQVLVRDPADIQGVLSAFVSVSRGVADIPRSALAASLAVQYGVQGDVQTAISAPVSVQRGGESGITSALSPYVSVEHGGTTGASALSPQVSVTYRGGTLDGGTTSYSPTVSVSTGPNITAVSPASVTRGGTVALTITGSNLSGASALSFINASGARDAALTVSNISVSADGTTLTATLVAGSSATTGRHVVVIATPNGDTLTVDVNVNVINVL
jgi:YD repeat-containing protein